MSHWRPIAILCAIDDLEIQQIWKKKSSMMSWSQKYIFIYLLVWWQPYSTKFWLFLFSLPLYAVFFVKSCWPSAYGPVNQAKEEKTKKSLRRIFFNNGYLKGCQVTKKYSLILQIFKDSQMITCSPMWCRGFGSATSKIGIMYFLIDIPPGLEV